MQFTKAPDSTTIKVCPKSELSNTTYVIPYDTDITIKDENGNWVPYKGELEICVEYNDSGNDRCEDSLIFLNILVEYEAGLPNLSTILPGIYYHNPEDSISIPGYDEEKDGGLVYIFAEVPEASWKDFTAYMTTHGKHEA